MNLKKLMLVCVSAIFAVACTQQAVEKKKPNIIFLFADDQCYQTIHALGNDEVKTPILDKMVDSGVTFTHAYNMGAWNGAVCQASRAMMNTGRFVWRAHKAKMAQLARDTMMWGPIMKKAGYTTYMTGKWHVSTPPQTCFDHVIHERPGMPHDNWDHPKMMKAFKEEVATGKKTADEIMPFGYNRPTSPADTAWRPWDKANGGFWEGGTHWSEVLRNDAIGFIEDAAKHPEPFFMYLAFNATHDPRQSPKEYIDMYPLENISLPESFQPEHPYKELIGDGRDLRDEALAPFPRTPYAIKVHRQEYYALLSHMDTQIGKILEALKKSGKMDNTYIFYTADHGLAVGNHGLIGKQSLYDHSIRPPFIVIGPDLPKGKRVDADVYLQDVMASALDLAGVDKPDYIEFHSVMKLARGERKESYYPAIYGGYIDYQRMIRKDGFKLLLFPKAKKILLFDLTNDPHEMHDLSADSKYAARKKQLFQDFLELQKGMDDPLDVNWMKELL